MPDLSRPNAPGVRLYERSSRPLFPGRAGTVSRVLNEAVPDLSRFQSRTRRMSLRLGRRETGFGTVRNFVKINLIGVKRLLGFANVRDLLGDPVERCRVNRAPRVAREEGSRLTKEI